MRCVEGWKGDDVGVAADGEGRVDVDCCRWGGEVFIVDFVVASFGGGSVGRGEALGLGWLGDLRSLRSDREGVGGCGWGLGWRGHFRCLCADFWCWEVLC